MKEIGKYYFWWMLGMLFLLFLATSKVVIGHFNNPEDLVIMTWIVIAVWTVYIFADMETDMDSDKNKGEEDK